MLTQVGVKQLTDFLRTVTAASDLADCTLVNCACDHLKLCLINKPSASTRVRSSIYIYEGILYVCFLVLFSHICPTCPMLSRGQSNDKVVKGG